MTAKAKQIIEIYSQNLEGIWFGLACEKDKIVSSYFGATEEKALSEILSNISFNVPFQILYEPSTFARSTFTSLKRLYDGQDLDDPLPLVLTHFPAYTKKVLKATMQVPFGYVTTYGSVAKAVGGGARAVGNVMASNRFAPIVPCHRVVKSDFTLGGYGMGGVKVKLELLNREKRGFTEPKLVETEGHLLKVFPVEFVLKNFPLH